MAHITETIAFDRRLQLGSESYVRKMKFGDSWSKIRIGIRCSFNGRNSPANNSLVIGVCRDDNGSPFGTRSSGFFGVKYSNATSWTYNQGQPTTSFLIQNNANTTFRYTKFDTTETSVAIIHALTAFAVAPATPHLIMITISRLAGVWTLVDTIFPTSAAQVQQGRTVPQFLVDMDDELGTRIGTGLTRNTHTSADYLTTSTLSFPYLCIGWIKSLPTIEITHIGVTRFY